MSETDHKLVFFFSYLNLKKNFVEMKKIHIIEYKNDVLLNVMFSF